MLFVHEISIVVVVSIDMKIDIFLTADFEIT
jgi:hypothetical protein